MRDKSYIPRAILILFVYLPHVEITLLIHHQEAQQERTMN
jgi:hypothetical protein